MRTFAMALMLILLPGAVTAQGGGDSAAEAVTVRQQIRQRWHEHIVTQLQLNQDQAGKLQATEDKYDGLRQPIQQRQVAIAVELNQQMQPGVAANNDLVNKLLDEREQNRSKLQDIDRQQNQDMAGYLTPVQRVRYLRQKQLFIARVQQMRERRMEGRPRPRRLR
jgi:Spy/CpxP family protein refolding chaperone